MEASKANYEQYLKRMTDSAIRSTKALIPFYAAGAKTILDVGCGSGVIGQMLRELYPDAFVAGVDTNSTNVNNARNSGWYDRVACCDFAEDDLPSFTTTPFDLVIFSSVLHEIGNYCADKSIQHTLNPLVHALKKARTILAKDGRIIVRDGLAEEGLIRRSPVTPEFAVQQAHADFNRFMEEFCSVTPEFTWGERLADIREEWRRFGEVPKWVVSEFVATYTWGMDSWPREIRERYCYAPPSEWRWMLQHSGFEITTEIQSPEEYPKYARRFISNWWDPNMSILFVAKRAY